MRIAFISTILNFPWGGADTLWTRAAEAAHERGDELLISVSPAVARSSGISALCSSRCELHLRSAPTAPPNRLTARVVARIRRSLVKLDDGLVARLSAFKPDLVVISCGGTYDLLLHPTWVEWFAAHRVRIRLIANWQRENPSLSPEQWAAAKASLRLAHEVFFVSQRNLEVTRRHLLEPLPQARVIHNPLRGPTTDLSPWPDANVPRLATVSRLDEGKGIHLLLHTLASLPVTKPWHLSIYGHGPAEAYLGATVEHLSLGNRVTFCGYVTSLADIWGSNELLVSPAIEDGVPMTIPEAMLCGRPVLATNVGGASDWLSDKSTGFICPAPTLPLLTATLVTALAQRNRWREMGQAAAASAAKTYRPDDYLHLIAP